MAGVLRPAAIAEFLLPWLRPLIQPSRSRVRAGDARYQHVGLHLGGRGQDARSVQRNVDDFSGFVEGDEKLNVPYTAKAQKYVDAYKPKRDIPYAQDGCRSPGLPIAMRMGGGIKFTYAPGLISIYMQSVGHTRFIRMNQKQGKTSPKYYGNSVGHWEGDTLVVETEDFLPEITFQYGVGKPLPPLETVGTANLGPPPGSAPPGGGPALAGASRRWSSPLTGESIGGNLGTAW